MDPRTTIVLTGFVAIAVLAATMAMKVQPVYDEVLFPNSTMWNG